VLVTTQRSANKPFLEMSEASGAASFRSTSMRGVAVAAPACPACWEKGWGRIVNFTRMNAIHGHAGRTPVSVASTAFGDHKAWHGVWAPEHTTNAISPGSIAPDSEEDNASSQAVSRRSPSAARPHGHAVESQRRHGCWFRRRRLHQWPDDPVNGGAET